tara:strand:- start:1929 stop:2822 length:894 start_codon:yes stop_codon:yes gene_type:complete
MKKRERFQQNYKRNDGFSLIEVMVVAGILGALSYFMMTLIDNQRKASKEIELRFSAIDTTQAIKALLASNDNCQSTFKDISKSDLLSSKAGSSLLTSISLKRTTIDGQSIVSEKYMVSNQNSNKSNLRILSYDFMLSDLEAPLTSETNQGEITLLVKFDLGNRKLVKKVPLFLTVDEDGKVQSCLASSTGGQSPILIIDATADASYKDLTGTQACSRVAKSCQYVISQNYAATANGAEGISSLCQVNYNRNKLTIKTGGPLSNIHDCDAKLGNIETYSITNDNFQVRCFGVFSAICQ